MAPEVISSRACYGPEVDYWSLGVVAYEFVYGTRPFSGSTAAEIFESVLLGEVHYPSNNPAQSAIVGLLTMDPTARSRWCEDYERVTSNSWFEDFDWDALQETTMKAPVPRPACSSTRKREKHWSTRLLTRFTTPW